MTRFDLFCLTELALLLVFLRFLFSFHMLTLIILLCYVFFWIFEQVTKFPVTSLIIGLVNFKIFNLDVFIFLLLFYFLFLNILLLNLILCIIILNWDFKILLLKNAWNLKSRLVLFTKSIIIWIWFSFLILPLISIQIIFGYLIGFRFPFLNPLRT